MAAASIVQQLRFTAQTDFSRSRTKKSAGPEFARSAKKFNGKNNSRDNSRSAKAFTRGQGLKAKGYSYEQMRETLLSDDDPEIAGWARTKGMANNEREMHRIYEKVGTGDNLYCSQAEKPEPTESLSTGMVLRGLQLLESNGKHWTGLPSKNYTSKDGSQQWACIVDFDSRETRQKFQDAITRWPWLHCGSAGNDGYPRLRPFFCAPRLACSPDPAWEKKAGVYRLAVDAARRTRHPKVLWLAGKHWCWVNHPGSPILT